MFIDSGGGRMIGAVGLRKRYNYLGVSALCR